MSEQFSNIGNEEQSYEQSYQQQSQSYVPFEDANAGIKSELHTIVDKLQLDEPPSEQTGRPLWQRVLAWAVPLWLIAFFVVWCYNARVDTCGGAKVTYRGNVLCITSERDYLLMNETYETEFLARDTSEPMPIDSLNQKKYDDLTETIKSKYADTTAQDVDTRMRLTFLNALRGNGMDSASYCRNLAMGYYNFAINYLNKGHRDSACIAYQVLKGWHWKDSVLTKTELAVLESICETKDKSQATIVPPSVPKPKVDTPKQVENPRQRQANTPPQYKEPILPTSKASDIKIGNLPIKPLETVENSTRAVQAGANNDSKRGLSWRISVFDKIDRKALDGATVEIRSEDGKVLYATETLKGNLMTWNGLEFGKTYLISAIKETYGKDSKRRAIDTKDATIYSDSLYLTPFSGLPLTLYFDNDSPDPNSRKMTTTYTYGEIFSSYYAKQTEYLNVYYKDNRNVTAAGANEISEFFQNKVKLGYDKLNDFSNKLMKYLDVGYGIEIVLEGYTSPLGESEYNRILSSREISSVINHFYKYNGGIFRSFINTGQFRISVEPYGEDRADKAVSDNEKDPRKSIYSVGAMKERKVEIKEMNVFEFNLNPKKN